MKLNNNLTASEYLIYNPFLVDEEVFITLKNNKVYDGVVESVYYNIDNRTIISIVSVVSIDDSCHLNLYEYIIVTYDLISKDYFFKIENNMYFQGLFKSEDILSILPNNCYNEEHNIRTAFQNLFECNYICKFKDTDICDKCFNFKEFKYIDDKKILLLGDRVKINNIYATILGIVKKDKIYYQYLIDGVKYNRSNLSFISIDNKFLIIHYRAGYLKRSDNNYYCDKCIFQECNKCLIKNYEIRK